MGLGFPKMQNYLKVGEVSNEPFPAYIGDDVGNGSGGDHGKGEEACHGEHTLLLLHTDWGRGNHWNNISQYFIYEGEISAILMNG